MYYYVLVVNVGYIIYKEKLFALGKLRSTELDRTHALVFVVCDPNCSSTCGLKPLLKRHRPCGCGYGSYINNIYIYIDQRHLQVH